MKIICLRFLEVEDSIPYRVTMVKQYEKRPVSKLNRLEAYVTRRRPRGII